MNWYRIQLEKEKLKSLHSRDNLKRGLQAAGFLFKININRDNFNFLVLKFLVGHGGY